MQTDTNHTNRVSTQIDTTPHKQRVHAEGQCLETPAESQRLETSHAINHKQSETLQPVATHIGTPHIQSVNA